MARGFSAYPRLSYNKRDYLWEWECYKEQKKQDKKAIAYKKDIEGTDMFNERINLFLDKHLSNVIEQHPYNFEEKMKVYEDMWVMIRIKSYGSPHFEVNVFNTPLWEDEKINDNNITWGKHYSIFKNTTKEEILKQVEDDFLE